MRREDQFIEEVLERVPHGPPREQIERDLRTHIAERVDAGMSVEDAIRQFGDPEVLAESYLSAIPLQSASFMARVGARMIDLPPIVVGAGLMLYVGWTLFGTGDISAFSQLMSPEKPPVFMAICVVSIALCGPGYYVVAEYLTDQTFGKHAMGLRVVRESGARIGLGQSFVRQIPLIGNFLIIDALFALFTDKKQRTFEMLSKTRVVRVEAA
jgi:uncharacterized RDD family membrane protein YckC